MNKSLKKHHRFIRYIISWVYQDLRPPTSSAPKGNSKFVITCRNKQSETNKQKTIKYFQLLWKKSRFYFSRKQSLFPFLDKALQWVNVKQKPFRYIWTHSDIIRHIRKLCRHIQNPV